MKEKKVTSLKIVFEDGNDYSLACEVGLDKDELAKYIERAFKPEPAEPLIKDEKIRKAVRAWADANFAYELLVDNNYGFSDYNGKSITFVEASSFHLSAGKTYTVAELCGEEEE